MAEIKLIATDIDGTLVKDSSPEIYPEMFDMIRGLTARGMRFVVSSGRSCRSIRHMFREVEAQIGYIAENGAHIHCNGEDLAVTGMGLRDREGIVKRIREFPDCEMSVSTPDGCYLESKNREFIDLIEHNYHNKVILVDDVLEAGDRIIKIAMYRRGSIRELADAIIPEWQDRVKACMAGEEWIDFMDASVDKGNALKYLQSYFGVAREETMAFGDNLNDIGLLRAAGESYAVENARTEVKKNARYICPSYHERGVYHMLETLLEREGGVGDAGI